MASKSLRLISRVVPLMLTVAVACSQAVPPDATDDVKRSTQVDSAGEAAVPERPPPEGHLKDCDDLVEIDPGQTPEIGCPIQVARVKDPISLNSWYKRLSWEEALSWWPHDPVLAAPDELVGGFVETVFASGPRLGRNADPRRELSYLGLFYSGPAHGPDDYDFFGILTSAGVAVKFGFCPPDYSHVCGLPPAPYRTVVVRGQAGYIVERRTTGDAAPERGVSKSNVDWRELNWYGTAEGGTQWFSVSNHPDLYTDEQTIAFADAMFDKRVRST